jgi:hypothetical protein
MMRSSSSVLTSFGDALATASMRRDGSFSTATTHWREAYQTNAQSIEQLRATLRGKPNVLIAGAGRQSGLNKIVSETQGWLRTGVHWSNFNPELPVDVITSTHTAPLEAALHASKPPLLLIHGVYSKVPPCLQRSFTIRWSDPFMLKEWKGKPTAKGIEELLQTKAIGVAPYIPAVRNTLFLNAMVMLWLGARRIVFTAVDPHHPDYFFSGSPELTLEIVRCLSATNPWLAEWDGRNERLGVIKRNTAHRVQEFTKNLLRQRSAVGGSDYLTEFDRGFHLLRQLAEGRGVKLGYLGESSYMATTGIPRLD